MTEKYMRIMMGYGRDLEQIRKVYQKHKAGERVQRNCVINVEGEIVIQQYSQLQILKNVKGLTFLCCYIWSFLSEVICRQNVIGTSEKVLL